jgi:hypothetical protein
MNKVDKLLKGILEEEMCAEMRTWLMELSILIGEERALRQPLVSGSLLSDEEMREPIENALYATKRFLTTQATDLAEGILEYIKDAGYTIVRNVC